MNFHAESLSVVVKNDVLARDAQIQKLIDCGFSATKQNQVFVHIQVNADFWSMGCLVFDYLYDSIKLCEGFGVVCIAPHVSSKLVSDCVDFKVKWM